jgi:hypothetical protein
MQRFIFHRSLDRIAHDVSRVEQRWHAPCFESGMRALTRRWHSPWHTSLALGALAVAAVAFRTVPAAADCSPPAMAIVWSYPAQGDTDVPTNVDLWLQTSGWDGPARVWLGEEAVPELPLAYGYDLGELAPHTEYKLRIEPTIGNPSFELRFTTGSGPASPDISVAPVAVTTSHARDYEASALCRAALNTQDCFDTGQNTYYEFTPSADAVGWVIQSDAGYRPINLWPGECGAPRLFGSDHSSPCVTLHAIDASGATHASERVCAGVDEGEPVDAEGCGLRPAPGSEEKSAPLALLGLALVLAWRARAR